MYFADDLYNFDAMYSDVFAECFKAGYVVTKLLQSSLTIQDSR